MSGIRVTYSGLISFAVGITSVFTGVIFTLIVTRTLRAEDFGAWNLIGGLIYYVIIAEPIISYWSTREIARGISSGKTAIFSSGIFSVAGVSAYLIIAYFVSLQLHIDQRILFFASILIPVMFLNRTLTAVNLGWKPQATSYGILSFEIAKIPAALVFVYFLHLGIYGAILSTIVGYIISIIMLGFSARDKIRGKFKIEFLRKWIKLSWLSAYPGLSAGISHLDVLIVSFISNSVIGLAFYSVSNTVSNIVANSSFISQSIYPKLLEGGKKEYLQENLLRFLYFAFPLSAISIVFAKPALFALNPIYESASIIIVFTTLRTFAYSLAGICSQALLGIETVDINEHATFKDFIKSRLFVQPTFILIQYIIYLVTLIVGFFLLNFRSQSTVELVTYWSIISLGSQIPFTVFFYLSARKHFALSMNMLSMIKYLLASIITFGIIYLFMGEFLSYKKSIFEFLPNVLLLVGIGTSCYLLITYFIDGRTRKLFHSIINELRGKNT